MKGLALALFINLPTVAWGQGQALRCVAAERAASLPSNTHLIQPAAGTLLARLQIGLPNPVTDVYVIEGSRQAAIFFVEGKQLCGGIVVDRPQVDRGLLSVLYRFGA